MPSASFEPDTYKRFVQAVQKVLKDRRATSYESALSANAIIPDIQSSFDWAPGSLRGALSKAANEDNESGIISSRGRGGGYWLDETVRTTAEVISKANEVEQEAVERRTRLKREEVLYEPVRRWLAETGYKAKNVADGRGGAKWSNPDVVGIRIDQEFGLSDIEIISVEVKLLPSNWRSDIFEAIAHKRFANRVYFCFPVTDGLDKVDDEIRRYSELYRVGVLQIYLDKSNFTALLDSRTQAQLSDIDFSQVNIFEMVEERIPAPYDFIPPRYQIEFLKDLGLQNVGQIHTFGIDAPRPLGR